MGRWELKDTEWVELRNYLEHSGMSPEQVMKACAQYQANKVLHDTRGPIVWEGEPPQLLLGL